MKLTALEQRTLKGILHHRKNRNVMAYEIIESKHDLEEYKQGSGLRAAWEGSELENRYVKLGELNQEYLNRLADAMEYNSLYDVSIEL